MKGKILVISFISILLVGILASIALQRSNKNDSANQTGNVTNFTNDILEDNQNQTYNKSIYNNSQNQNITNKINVANKANIARNNTNITGNNTKNETNKTVYTYKRQENKGVITYRFNTGEILELKISNNSISKDNAVYRTNATGNYIVFAGEKYEKLIPGKVMYLAPITHTITNKTLKINEILKLRDNYSFVIYEINNREFKSKILKNNKVVRTDIINRNATILSIGFWKEINEFKRQKVLWIDPIKINQRDIIVDVTQYGDKKVFIPGNKFGEFQITNITDDSITMKNFQIIKAEKGKDVLLMNGKIKIKI